MSDFQHCHEHPDILSTKTKKDTRGRGNAGADCPDDIMVGLMQASGLRQAWAAVCFVLALSSSAMAQDYPTRTIKMIVPTGAGGVTDILARLVGKSISDQLGQPVIIDNRTGAGGTIGTRRLHLADGVSEPCRQPCALCQPALRQRKGLCPDLHGDQGQ